MDDTELVQIGQGQKSRRHHSNEMMYLPIFATHLRSCLTRRIQDSEIFQKRFVPDQSGFFPIVSFLYVHGFGRTRGNSWFTMAVELKLVALVRRGEGFSQNWLA